MKSGNTLVGPNLITFTIPDAQALRNKSVVLVVTIDGRKELDYRGPFPPSGGLTVGLNRVVSKVSLIQVDTTIDGVAIAAARDGTISVTTTAL